MTWAEYLKANGASDEEVKILDTAPARRAFDKQQADLAAASARADDIEKNMKAYEDRVQAWYDENDAKLKKVQNESIVAKAEAERAKAAILAAQEKGLVDIAKDLGWTVEPPLKKETGLPEGFDPSKFVTTDALEGVAERVGASLAALEDMVMEHKLLFPDIPLRVSALRAEALAAKKPINQYWEEKFKVPAAREAAATAQRNAEIAKWKAEGAKEKETELVSKYGSPETRPLVPSHSPFTKRANDPKREKQPWDHADGTLSNDRVLRATQNLVKQTVQ